MSKFLKGFHFAFQGIISATTSEINFRVHLAAAFIAILLGFLCQISQLEWCIVIILIGWVLMAELFNTAIEALADLISKEIHPQIKKIKDITAGAVLISSISALIAGVVIFSKYMIEFCRLM